MSTVYIAFGSNLGDREGNIEKAIGALGSISEGSIRVSSLWESAPVDMEDCAGHFLNGVVRLETSLTPRELLVTLQGIETLLGRAAEHRKNQSRTIDLDIICIDDCCIDEGDLVVPHPRARDRRFVLAPLAEIAPELILPGEAVTVNELLHAAPPMEVRRVSENT